MLDGVISLTQEAKDAVKSLSREWNTAQIKIDNLKAEQKDIVTALADKLDVKPADVAFALRTAYKDKKQDYENEVEARDALLDIIVEG